MLSPELIYNSDRSAGYSHQLGSYAAAYRAGGDTKNLAAAENAVRKIREKALQLTGGIPSHAEFLAPVSASVETEYCAFAFLQSSLIHLAQASGDPGYLDLLERIVFNGAQGARKKDEKAIAYMSSPNQLFANAQSGLFIGNMQQYAPVYPTACCSVTSCWIIPNYLRSMAMCADDGIYVTSYGPAVVNCGEFTLNIDTHYPFRDTVRCTVSAGADVKTGIHFRIPSWCDAAEITVNGTNLSAKAQPGTYYKIRRIWKNGDVIDLRFPMRVRLSRVDDSGAYARYPMALEYGPLLFSFKLPEIWTAVQGSPRTPLPEGWSWWDVNPEMLARDERGALYDQNGLRRYNISWNIAIDENLSPDNVKVELCDGGYVWENPQVKLRLPAYKALYCYPPYPQKTMDPYSGPIDVYGEMEIELVPYGCTSLRISYIPRAKLPVRPMPKAGLAL